MHYASPIYPSATSFLGIARELTAGQPTLPTNTVPIGANYEPEDTPEFLRDEGLRAVMADVYNETLGVEISQFSFSGPGYLDVDGFFLDNAFGDLSSTSNGTLGTAQALSSALAVGATSLTVGVSLGSVTTGSVIQISDGAASEIVIATAGSTGTAVNFTNTPCRFAHSTSATAALQTAATNYSHTFALLNSGTGQAPTHSLTDYTGITATTGARTYPSAVVTGLEFGGGSQQVLTRSVSGQAWLSAASASTPSNTVSAAAPVPVWRASVTINGSAVYNVADWKAQFSRAMVPYWTAQSAQTPAVLARGPLSVGLSVEQPLAVNEAPLTNMLSGGLMPVVFTVSNGLAGAGALSMTVTMTKAQTVTAKPTRGAGPTGYSTTWAAVANSTDVGGSGGLGPAVVQLTNAIATY